ncbi:MAG: hypothetical protein KME14_07765 [Tildeniella torsiva UHER 1998/13D]|jgi:acyl carrier protein|nr:hypothetical protein [Tildeniella torsiva UHER 1998/13D]
MNDDYESKILANVICRYLNEREPVKEADISRIELSLDDTVWGFAVNFYNESGHKADFTKIRNIVDYWIKLKKEELIRAETVSASLQKPETSPDCTSEKLDLPRKLSHSDNQQKKFPQNSSKEIPKNFDENKERASILNKFAKLVSEQLKVDQDLVSLDTNLSDYPRVVDLDFCELVMAVEEEFEIEIDDAEFENRLGILDLGMGYLYPDFVGFRISFWGKKPKKRTEKPSPSELKSKCVMVKNFVDLIYEKLYV